MAPKPVVGVDFSIGMCGLARAKGILAHHADISALPFAAEQFSLIYCVGIIHYIDDLPALLAEFARVCRSGGKIVVTTVNRVSAVRRGLQTGRKLFPRAEMPHSYRYIFRTAAEVEAAASGLPLALSEVSWTHFPLPWLHRSQHTPHPLEFLASDAILGFIKLPGRP
jgi:ubiquinone/menaquinone biosynthesis C-methylase UbiE